MALGMNTDEIECLLRKSYKQDTIPATFRGVFPRDQLPLPFTKWPSGCVVNTDTADQPGKHWVSFYQPSASADLEYFDSYGVAPEVYGFRPPNGYLLCCDTQLQHDDSETCGHYCVFFLIHRPLMPSLASAVQLIRSLIRSLTLLASATLLSSS